MLDAARTPQYNPRGEKYLEAGQNDLMVGNLISVRGRIAIRNVFLISLKNGKKWEAIGNPDLKSEKGANAIVR